MLRPITLNAQIYAYLDTLSATNPDPTLAFLNASVVILLVVSAVMDPTTLRLKSTLEPKYTNVGNGAAKTLKLDATTTATHMELTWEWDSVTPISLKLELDLDLVVMTTITNLMYQLRDTPESVVKVKIAAMKDLPTSHG